jgi:capsular exopolysaccharide synthesis family protein
VSEAYAAILAALRFSTPTGAPRKLLVTSTRASEGKSSSAFALAQNSARRGARVLLIDADLRRPVFRVESKKLGLTKLLTNDEAIDGHFVSTQQENLWLMPCGPTPPNPADLLSTQRIDAIVNEAVAKFDLVVIDGPPTLGLADAALLASSVGNVLMIIESGKTRTRAVRESLDRLKSTGANIVGVTLTKSTEESSHYGYRYYSYGSVDKRSVNVIAVAQQPTEVA